MPDRPRRWPHRCGVIGLVLLLVVCKYLGLLAATAAALGRFVGGLPQFSFGALFLLTPRLMIGAVGFAVTLTVIASSNGSLRLNLVIEKLARRPWEPAWVIGPSITANSIGVLPK